MDKVQRVFWELRLRSELLRVTGNEFQAFFYSLMTNLHGGDFVRVKPWGGDGDRKCDGFLLSEKRLFCVYAPEVFVLARARAKVRDDLTGVLVEWRTPDDFSIWTLVYNCPGQDGVPAGLTAEVLSQSLSSRGVRPEFWGREMLIREFWRLPDSSKESMLGPAPTMGTLLQAGIPEVSEILEHVAASEGATVAEVKPVSSKKLEQSGLSNSVRELVKAGIVGQGVVDLYIRRHPETDFGDRVCSAFRSEYERLAAAGVLPDDVFSSLMTFTGVGSATDVRRQGAALGVLAYLFERCDIYRNAEEVG